MYKALSLSVSNCDELAYNIKETLGDTLITRTLEIDLQGTFNESKNETVLDSIQSSEFLLSGQKGCKILPRIKKRCKPCP